MTIESTLDRIATALEKATMPSPAEKPATTSPAPDPQQAETLEPDHEETTAPPSTDEERNQLTKAIGQLIKSEPGTDQARAILLTFHGAQKIADLKPDEYEAVTVKMLAAYLDLDS